jgi:hypothetical protein
VSKLYFLVTFLPCMVQRTNVSCHKVYGSIQPKAEDCSARCQQTLMKFIYLSSDMQLHSFAYDTAVIQETMTSMIVASDTTVIIAATTDPAHCSRAHNDVSPLIDAFRDHALSARQDAAKDR